MLTTQTDRIQRPPVIDYKLRNVPELGYFSTDKPYPRGELLAKSLTQLPGFFKRPQQTATLFDEESYVITEDIMEERGPDHIVYIDRCNDALKLSQAEFFAPGKLAATFEASLGIEDIEALLAGEHHGLPSFESIHGNDTKVLEAKNLDITRFLDQDTLKNIPYGSPVVQARTILVTGATGFLGRCLCLCLEWMERIAAMDGKVICIFRANSNESARARLDAVFSGVNKDLEQLYQALAAKHLEVIAADISEYHFGLTAPTRSRLTEEVDQIMHAAALVNQALSYQHLFGPNIAGTAELIKLALNTRQKRFDFVSSMAVGAIRAGFGHFDEDSPLPETLELSDGYASGYGLKKWARL